jgi:hypothetical protein
VISVSTKLYYQEGKTVEEHQETRKKLKKSITDNIYTDI